MGAPIYGQSLFTPDYTEIPNPYYDGNGNLEISGQSMRRQEDSCKHAAKEVFKNIGDNIKPVD